MFYSIRNLAEEAIKQNKKISEIILEDQVKETKRSVQSLYQQMEESFAVMEAAVIEGSDQKLRSVSGLSGGDAYRMKEYTHQGKNLLGAAFGNVLTKALAVSELNAAMGKIVAAPTAGSCGILPACLLSMKEQHQISRQDTVMALFTAAGIGMIIANKASISGAEGGCQAECGSASAMAAGALVELAGGTPFMVCDACAIALKGLLGLVCDPVAGLVEVPCIKRNAMGAANAYMAAELALAGIESKIPVDEVVIAMKQVGQHMPVCFKETAQGGLADTETGRRIKKEIFGGKNSDEQ